MNILKDIFTALFGKSKKPRMANREEELSAWVLAGEILKQKRPEDLPEWDFVNAMRDALDRRSQTDFYKGFRTAEAKFQKILDEVYRLAYCKGLDDRVFGGIDAWEKIRKSVEDEKRQVRLLPPDRDGNWAIVYTYMDGNAYAYNPIVVDAEGIVHPTDPTLGEYRKGRRDGYRQALKDMKHRIEAIQENNN